MKIYDLLKVVSETKKAKDIPSKKLKKPTEAASSVSTGSGTVASSSGRRRSDSIVV